MTSPLPTSAPRPGGWWVDAALALTLGFVGVIGTLHVEASGHGERSADAGAVACVLVAAVGVLFWRAWPVVGAALGLGAVVVYTARDYAGGPIYLLGAVVLYGLAVTIDRRRAYLLAFIVGLLVFVASTIAQSGFAWNDLFFFVWPVVAVLVADVVRGQRERTAVAAARQAEEQQRLLAEANRQRAEERLSLARDLHDSVAHAMATINVQAGVAAHILDRDPHQAHDSLEAIRVASRDVLDELGVMLEVLRESEGAPRQPGRRPRAARRPDRVVPPGRGEGGSARPGPDRRSRGADQRRRLPGGAGRAHERRPARPWFPC